MTGIRAEHYTMKAYWWGRMELNHLPTPHSGAALSLSYFPLFNVLCQRDRPRTGIFSLPRRVDVHLSPLSDITHYLIWSLPQDSNLHRLSSKPSEQPLSQRENTLKLGGIGETRTPDELAFGGFGDHCNSRYATNP